MKYYNLDGNKLYTKEQAIKIEEEKSEKSFHSKNIALV